MKSMKKKLSPGEYRYVRAELAGYLRKKGLSSDESDDIIQDSIYKYLTSSAIIPADKTRNYLQKIATNTYRDYLRERSRFLSLPEDPSSLPELDVRSDIIFKTHTEILSQILQDEPEKSAGMKAFKSFYLDGKKLHLIAKEHDVPLGTVTSWVKRNRDRSVRKFKERLEALDLDFVGNQPLLLKK